MKLSHFLLGLLISILHGAITVTQMFFVKYGITVGTPVPETPVEFVHGVGVLSVAIHGEANGGHAILSSITDVLNVMALTGMKMVWVGTGHQVMIFQVFVGELIQGLLAPLVIAPG